MAYWIEFKQPALGPCQRSLELLGFIPMLQTAHGGGSVPGKATVELFRCSRKVDWPTSQLIARATNAGQAFDEVVLGASQGSGRDARTVVFTLMLTLIRSYSVGEMPDPVSGKPIEVFDLVFQNFKQDTP